MIYLARNFEVNPITHFGVITLFSSNYSNALKDASVGAPSLEAFKACLRQLAASAVFNLTVNIPHTKFCSFYMRTPEVAECVTIS
jgi:hypothetical protein